MSVKHKRHKRWNGKIATIFSMFLDGKWRIHKEYDKVKARKRK